MYTFSADSRTYKANLSLREYIFKVFEHNKTFRNTHKYINTHNT
jgi:hypothetical protein